MDPNLAIQQIRIEHQHKDGSWAPLQPVHHDPASHDPERGWRRHLIYRCISCEETLTITPGEEGEPAAPNR